MYGGISKLKGGRSCQTWAPRQKEDMVCVKSDDAAYLLGANLVITTTAPPINNHVRRNKDGNKQQQQHE